MIQSLLIVPNRDGRIESHTAAMLDDVETTYGSEVDVFKSNSSALLEHLRCETMERAFTHSGYRAVAFLDSDISVAPHVDAINVLRLSVIDREPTVRVGVFADRDFGTVVGKNLHLLQDPPMADRALSGPQRAPRACLFGAGFVSVNRDAWHRLNEVFPETVNVLGRFDECHTHWRSSIVNGVWQSEAYSFFQRVHEAGIPVIVEPIRLGHGRGGDIKWLW